MKCPNCGFESELNYPVCPQCQAEIQANPAAQNILRALKDTLFLVLCILMSASCVLSLSAGDLPLINILTTVFLWLTYAQSRKGIADAKHLRCVSGAVYARYVINYVVAVLIVVVGLIFTVAFGLILGEPSVLESLVAEFEIPDISNLSQMLAIIPSGIIMVVFVFAAAIIVVINIFTLRYLHRFAQSVYQSIETGVLNLKYATAAKVCMFILGGCSAVSCLGNLDDMELLLVSAVDCAIGIIAGLLIHKYLCAEPAAPTAIQDGNA